MISKQIIVFLFPILSLAACAQEKQVYQSPPGYDFNKPIKYYMPDDLLGISGIAFENGNSDLLYAEPDEEGKVFFAIVVSRFTKGWPNRCTSPKKTPCISLNIQ